MTRFKDPNHSLRDLDAEIVAALITRAADLAVVLNHDGIITDVCHTESLSADQQDSWIGRAWADTVTIESRTKVRDLLREALSGTMGRPRQVNHPGRNGPDLPVLYSVIRLGHGRLMALGRDLSGIAALQQRLIEAQQAIERDYARLRRVETRYRVLFQMSSEAILIVDSATNKIEEANPAACGLLGHPAGRLSGRPVLDCLDPDSAASVRALLANVRASGQTSEVRVRLQESRRELTLSASLFRQDQTVLFLLHLALGADEGAASLSGPRSRLLELAEAVPDGLVVTDRDGRVQSANAAFLDLVQLASEVQVIGQSLDRWLGRPAVDLSLLTSSLREHGSVRLHATNVRGEFGAVAEVEISAVVMLKGDAPVYGFSVRSVGRRLGQEPAAERALSRSTDQLTELVGRVPLKDIVRETADVIERLCIESALQLTADNRASAAEMLGLSRQSLYVKLRRYGIGDLEPDGQA